MLCAANFGANTRRPIPFIAIGPALSPKMNLLGIKLTTDGVVKFHEVIKEARRGGECACERYGVLSISAARHDTGRYLVIVGKVLSAIFLPRRSWARHFVGAYPVFIYC